MYKERITNENKRFSIKAHLLPITHADIRENVGDRNKRHQFEGTVSRKHFLSCQDVRSIKRKVDKDQVMRHCNDAPSILMRVNELRQESFNPVLIYKEQGVPDTLHSNLPEDSFVLAVQTEFQQKLYIENAHKILCVDSRKHWADKEPQFVHYFSQFYKNRPGTLNASIN